jgi:TatD DNase family protein
MLIDTHCHLDAQEFDEDRNQVVAQAVAAGVRAVVIPAIARANFQTVRDLAHAMPGGAYALGIHPLYVGSAWDDDLTTLRAAVEASMDDPRFVAIGEIGLDFFVKEIASGEAREKQERYYAAQLDLAAEFGLPVLLHVRRSQDIVLKHLRRHRGLHGGIAHAFNGSEQQARGFIDLGFALGIGGAMTFPRSLQIRRHARQLGLEHLVLETDAPDIPPAWLHGPDRRNTPGQVAGVAHALADLRETELNAVTAGTAATALRVLPRLAPIVA